MKAIKGDFKAKFCQLNFKSSAGRMYIPNFCFKWNYYKFLLDYFMQNIGYLLFGYSSVGCENAINMECIFLDKFKLKTRGLGDVMTYYWRGDAFTPPSPTTIHHRGVDY